MERTDKTLIIIAALIYSMYDLEVKKLKCVENAQTAEAAILCRARPV